MEKWRDRQTETARQRKARQTDTGIGMNVFLRSSFFVISVYIETASSTSAVTLSFGIGAGSVTRTWKVSSSIKKGHKIR